jgi:hypothetical protein
VDVTLWFFENPGRLFSLWPFEQVGLVKTLDFIGDLKIGAGEGNRTLISGLGSPHSTTEPHPLRLSPRLPFTRSVPGAQELILSARSNRLKGYWHRKLARVKAHGRSATSWLRGGVTRSAPATHSGVPEKCATANDLWAWQSQHSFQILRQCRCAAPSASFSWVENHSGSSSARAPFEWGQTVFVNHS